MISYLQAVVIGLLQGVTELFPVSSLGHSVLVPAFIGGSWETLVTQSATSTSETSPYLAVIVALHVATALALIIFFRSDWVRIIRGFGRTIRPSLAARRLITTDADERLAWLLVIATIPVGITGLALEHTFRTLFAKPLAAAIFLTINGLILLAGEVLRRRAPTDADDRRSDADTTAPLGRPAARNTTSPSSSPTRRRRHVAWPPCTTAKPPSSGPFRRSPCSPGSAAPASPWSAAWPADCPTATPPGSPSCSPPRSSWPPACSNSRPWPARPATTSTDKSSSAPSSPDWRPTCR